MSAGGSRAEEPRPHAVALYRQHCRFRLRVSHKARRGGIGYRELRTARVARVEESRPEGRSRDTGQSDQGGGCETGRMSYVPVLRPASDSDLPRSTPPADGLRMTGSADAAWRVAPRFVTFGQGPGFVRHPRLYAVGAECWHRSKQHSPGSTSMRRPSGAGAYDGDVAHQRDSTGTQPDWSCQPRRFAGGLASGWPPFSASRVRARPEASSRHRRRPLEPHRSCGRGSQFPRDLASLGDQPGLASSLASSSWPPSPASSCWSTVLLGCLESRPRSSRSLQFAPPWTRYAVRTSSRSCGQSRFCQWLPARAGQPPGPGTSSVHLPCQEFPRSCRSASVVHTDSSPLGLRRAELRRPRVSLSARRRLRPVGVAASGPC